MEDENFNSADGRPAYSPIPPDEPPKKSAAGLAVIIIVILILIVAGVGVAAALLLNSETRVNAKALKEKTPAEYLLWVEEKWYDAQKTKITERSKNKDTVQEYPNGLTQKLVIDGSITEEMADELDLDGAKNFSLQIDTSAKEALLGAAFSFVYGGADILSAQVSADLDNGKGMLQLTDFADGWYDFSDLFTEGTYDNPLLNSVGSALRNQADTSAEETETESDPLEGVLFSEDLYTSVLSYFEDYKLTQKKQVKANGVEGAYTEVQATLAMPKACNALSELLIKIRDSSYFMDVLYGGDQTSADAARDSIDTLRKAISDSSSSFTEEDLLTYTVWIDNTGKVKGRDLSMTVSGQSAVSIGYKVTTAKKNTGYSIYLQVMGTTICDIHGTAVYRDGTFSGSISLNIPTDLASDVYMDPMIIRLDFSGLGKNKSGGFYGDFTLSMSMPEEIVGSTASYNMERYSLKFSLPKNSKESELTMTLQYKQEERASLHFTYSKQETFTEPVWPGASDAVTTAAGADSYFSRENYLKYLDLIEEKMNEPELEDFFEALRSDQPAPSLPSDLTDGGDADSDNDGSGDIWGSQSSDGKASISTFPAVMAGLDYLTADQLPFYFVSFLEDYQITYQSDLEYYDEATLKEEILNRLHQTLACAQEAEKEGITLTEDELAEVEDIYDSWIDYSYTYQNESYTSWPWDEDALKKALTDSQLAEKYKSVKLKAEGFDEEAVLAAVPVPVTYNLDEFILYKDILTEAGFTEDEMRGYLEDSIAYYNDTVTQEEKQKSIEEDNLIMPWLDALELSHPEVNWDKFYDLVTGGYGYLEWYTDAVITPDNSYYPEEFKTVFAGVEDGDMTHLMEFDDSFIFFYQWDSYEDPDEYEYSKSLTLNEAKEAEFEKYYEGLMEKYPLTTMFGWDEISLSSFVYED